MDIRDDHDVQQQIRLLEEENAAILYQMHQEQQELEHYHLLAQEYTRRIADLHRRIDVASTSARKEIGKFEKLTDLLGISMHRQIESIRASGLFNEPWYLEQFPDVAESGVDPVLHYCRFGAKEGRNPGPQFDTQWYLRKYPDVARASINPLLHYVLHGEREGRQPCQDGASKTPDPFAQERQWLLEARAEQAELAAERQDRIDDLGAINATLEKQNSLLTQRLDTIERGLAASRRQHDEKAQRVIAQDALIDELAQAKARLASENSSLVEHRNALQQARDEDVLRATERQARIDGLREAVALLELENSRLLAAKQALERELSTKQQSGHALEQDNARLTAERARVERELSASQQAGDEQTRLAGELTGRIEQLIQAHAILNEEKLALVAQSEALRGDLSKQQQAGDEQARLATERLGVVDQLTSERAALEMEQSTLAARLDKAEKRAAQSRAELSEMQRIAEQERIEAENQFRLIKEIIVREPLA